VADIGDGSEHPSSIQRFFRLLTTLSPVVQMFIGLVGLLVAIVSVKVIVLSGPGTKTVTVPTPPTTITVAAPPASSPGLGWLSNISNPPYSNFNEVVGRSVTVDGETYAHTVQLVGTNSSCNGNPEPSYVSFLVPAPATQLTGLFGWGPESNGASDELIVFEDSLNGKVLWHHPFPNAGLPLIAKHIEVAGIHAVIFELTAQSQCDMGKFVLAEAQFTS
jgi:hypothetical protein